jgi:hypothetical protein
MFSEGAMRQACGRSVTAFGLLCAHLALCMFLTWRVIVGRSSLIAPGDSADQSLCWLGKVFGAAKRGELVLWDFSTMAGVSFIGELQTAPLYPQALLFGLCSPLDTWRTVDLFLVAHFLLASVGMHACASRMGISHAGAFVAAAIYAYGTTFALRVSGQPNLFASLAWMPIIVLCARGAVSAHGGRVVASWSMLAGAATAMSVLAGHVHSAVLSVCAALPFAIHAAGKLTGLRARAGRLLVVGTVAGATAIGLAAPQLAATVEYMRLSYKWYGPGYTTHPHVVPFDVFKGGSLSGSDLLTLVNGNQVQALDGGTLHLTIAGLAMALCGIAMWWWLRDRDTSGAVVAAVALAAAAIAFAYPVLEPLGRLFHNLPAIGLVRTPARGLFVFAFAMGLLAGYGLDSLMFAMAGTGSRRRPWRIRTAWTCGALAIVTVIVEVKLWLPDRIMVPVAEVPRAVADTLHGPVLEALLELPIDQRNRYRYFASREDVPPNIGNVVPLLSAHGYRSSRTQAFHDYFDFSVSSPRADALAVRWWVSDRPLLQMTPLMEVAGKFIYERKSSAPVFWQRGADGKPSDPGVADVKWSSNEVEARFVREVKGQVIFAQMFFPGFQATADGEPVEVKSVEGLMALDLERPAETLRIFYRPDWLTPSMLVAVVTLLSTGAVLAWTALGNLHRRTQSRKC